MLKGVRNAERFLSRMATIVLGIRMSDSEIAHTNYCSHFCTFLCLSGSLGVTEMSRSDSVGLGALGAFSPMLPRSSPPLTEGGERRGGRERGGERGEERKGGRGGLSTRLATPLYTPINIDRSDTLSLAMSKLVVILFFNRSTFKASSPEGWWKVVRAYGY